MKYVAFVLVGMVLTGFCFKETRSFFSHQYLPASKYAVLILLLSFGCILIEGEHLGGFYFLYILLALPQGTPYALSGTTGIVLLVVNSYFLHPKDAYLLNALLNIAGGVLLLVSLFLFFHGNAGSYNHATLEQAFPVTMITLFFLISTSFIIKNSINVLSRLSL